MKRRRDADATKPPDHHALDECTTRVRLKFGRLRPKRSRGASFLYPPAGHADLAGCD